MLKIKMLIKKAKDKTWTQIKAKYLLATCMINVMFIYTLIPALATNGEQSNGNTESIDSFIDFICDWLIKIGGVVALVGGVMFALGWQRDDAEGKTKGLMTLMAGFMLVAIGNAPGIFGI